MVGVDYKQFGESLQSLSTELSVAGDLAHTPQEQAMIADYSAILDVYRASLTIWTLKVTPDSPGRYMPSADFMMVFERDKELSTILVRYNIPLNGHLNENLVPRKAVLGQAGSFSPNQAINMLWAQAATKLTAAEQRYVRESHIR